MNAIRSLLPAPFGRRYAHSLLLFSAALLCGCADVLRVDNVRAVPARPYDRNGVEVSARVTNVSENPVEPVSWTMTPRSGPYWAGGSDHTPRLAPRQSTTIRTQNVGNFGASEDERERHVEIIVSVDPEHTLQAEKSRTNNKGTASFDVQPQIFSQLAQTERRLSFARSREAGASFWESESRDTFQPATDAEYEHSGRVTDNVEEIVFEVDAVEHRGARIEFTAYHGLTLRHGWKVKSCTFTASKSKKNGLTPGTANFTVHEQPQEGSNTPKIRLTVAADTDHRITVLARVLITGPQDFDPYLSRP